MEYNGLSDEDLVKIIKAGNILTFEILVSRYQNRLLSFVKRIIFDKSVSEEIVQDAFLNVYKTIDRIDTNRKFSTYIFTVAKNLSISFLRKKIKEVSLNEKMDINSDEEILENLIRKETSEKVKKLISDLSDKYKIVIKLYYYDNLSYDDIAGKLKLPVNTVRTHLRRAKEILKEKLKYEN